MNLIERARVRTQGNGSRADDERPVVLHVHDEYLPPGRNWIYDQMSRVQRYRIVVATESVRSLTQFPHDSIYSMSLLPRQARWAEAAMQLAIGRGFFFTSVAKQTRAKLLHAHFGNVGAFIAPTAANLRLPLVVSFYGADMWSHKRRLAGLRRRYRTLTRTATRVIAEGPAAANRLVDLGFQRDIIRIRTLGVDVERIPYVERQLCDGTRLNVLMASRFTKKKGLEYGVEGFARIAKHHPSMHLMILGKGDEPRDDRMAGELISIAKRHGVEGQVEIKGFVALDRLLNIASSRHVFLQPSITPGSGDAEGGHPVTLTLLAAHGMPMIGTRHCDIPQIVRDGETGWLVDERDAEAIAAALAEIVENPGEAARRGTGARKLVEDIYDLRKSSLDDLYDELL